MRRDLELGDLAAAARALPIALLRAPEHPETLRLAGAIHRRRGDLEAAEHFVRDAIAAAPDDAELVRELGSLLSERGNSEAAIECLRGLCDTEPSAPTFLELGIAYDRVARVEEALDSANRALALGSADPRTALLRARCQQMLGNAEGAAEQYRGLIRNGQEVAKAWFALLDIKTVVLSDNENRLIRKFAADPKRSFEEKLLLDFAMARVHESAGEFDDALRCLARGNAGARSRVSWNAGAHRSLVAGVANAFARLPPAHDQPALGREVIFIVSLPRSGSTLVEQILAAHPQVEGASELGDLPAVIDAESKARGKPFPDWVADASADDWLRLGRDYLARTERWRRERPTFTDKTLDNWKYAGAIAAMLPAARVIDCRRDALETCWSCYKQLFGPGVAGFAYSFDDLASYWKDYLGLCASGDNPGFATSSELRNLASDPARQTSLLLKFCGLEFDDRALHPERVARAVRTSSSAQVRQPIHRAITHAAAYGDRLAALQTLLKAERDFSETAAS